MEASKEFSIPTKIHFVARSNRDIGVVFADHLVRTETEVIFYFGKARVAVLGMNVLLIGSRKIPRSVLHPDKPYSYDSSPSSDQPVSSCLRQNRKQ